MAQTETPRGETGVDLAPVLLKAAHRPLRIGIDAGLACAPRPTGVQHFARSLLDALLRLELPNVTWHLFLPPGQTPPCALPPGATARARTFASKTPGMVVQSWLDRVDVIYTFGHNLPARCRGARVVTIHDLIFETHPDCYSPEQVTHFRRTVADACRRAARIATPSQATREEIANRFGFPLHRIDVISAGYRPIFRPDANDSLPPALVKAGVTSPFFLSVGRLNRRKNLERVIAAYRRMLSRGVNAALVLAGPDHFGSDEVRAHLAADPQPGERIIVTNYVGEDELVTLYRRAVALLYPSLAEGFGLPILEAMACETPVITSTISSMPEVAGRAAILVDPCDTAAIADAMEQVLTQPGLRAQLAAAGLARVKEFTWRRSAERLAASLLRAAQQSTPSYASGPVTESLSREPAAAPTTVEADC